MKVQEIAEKQFDSFCKTVLRNEARNIYAEKKRWNEKFVSFSEMSEELCAYDLPEIDVSVCGKKVLIKDLLISEAIATLSEKQQVVILHSFFLQKTDKAIGSLMGIHNSTVRYESEENHYRFLRARIS